MNCDFQEHNGKYKYKCTRCGQESPVIANCNCKVPIKVDAQIPQSLTEPSTLKKLMNFSSALSSHIKDGLHKCTQEEIDARLNICKDCPLFKLVEKEPLHGICTHPSCGCNLRREQVFLNKLAWKSSECPLKKW